VAKSVKRWRAHDLVVLLRQRYGCDKDNGGKYAMLTEVANGTGGRAGRYCDALVFGLRTSLGCDIDGFEIKVARGDWLSEIQDPSKAEAFIRYSDRWWILAAPGIVKLGELPATWGLMEPGGKGLRVRKPAEKTGRDLAGRSFMASVARYSVRACPSEAAIKSAVDSAVKAERERVKRLGCDYSETGLELRRLRNLERSVSEFEARSGVKIDTYNGMQMGSAFHAAVSCGLGRFEQILAQQIKSVEAKREYEDRAIQRDKERLAEFRAALAEGAGGE